jgi:hypothetical protein
LCDEGKNERRRNSPARDLELSEGFFFYCYEARAPAQPDAANTSPAQSFFLFHLKKNKNKGYYFFVSFCVDKIFYLLLPFIVRVEI